ncbi:MAG: CBS domain-containing protein [Deltaproteobacteria bacterium]|nr:CBS domain-containing protein [Deltaproteobacteria bacterium]
MRRVTIKDIMTHPVHVLMADETLELAEAMMRVESVRHLPVLDANRVVGVVTSSDLLRASLEGVWQREGLLARELMSDLPPIVGPSDAAVEAAVLLRNQAGPGCVLVVDSGKLVGIVTPTNFLDLAIRSLDPGV